LVKDVALVEVTPEAGTSTKLRECPGPGRLLALVETKPVVMIVEKLDRLTCSVADLNTLIRRFERPQVGR
jgi:hypothetical protein